MTKQADGVDPGPIEHVRIWPAVRKMTGDATFGLDYVMFILKWTGHLGMALGADEVLLCRRALKLLPKAPVRLMTVGAQHQSLFHFMAEYGGELSPLFIVTLKAQLRLGGCKQILRLGRSMNAVAPNAAYMVPGMNRALKDYMLAGVALQAAIVYLHRIGLCRVEDL